MKHPHSYLYHIMIFVLAQVAWLSLLGIWIYWYITNYIIFSEVDHKLSAQIMSEGQNVFVLVSGLILLIVVSVLMSLQFHRLNTQLNLTHLYDNFIANVTHELKSPLASIQLALETMSLRNLNRDKQNEFITMMLKDTDRLNILINAILEIPALEQKKIAHNFYVYNMDSLVRELMKESMDQFNLTDEHVQINGKATCKCVVDRNAFKIVLDNLTDNAIKYSITPPRISLTMKCGAKQFILDFMDNGIGMSAHDQKKVFDKFYRIQNRHSPNVKGTGLGLYWTREIIKVHDGKMTVSSKGRNRGANFHIELPIYKATRNRYIQNLLKIAQKRRRQKEDVIDE